MLQASSRIIHHTDVSGPMNCARRAGEVGDLLTLDVQGTSRPWYTACLYCQVLLALTATFGGPGIAGGGCACSVEGFQQEPYEQPNLLPTSGSRRVLQRCRGLGEELEREGGGIPLDVSIALLSLSFAFQPIDHEPKFAMLSPKASKMESSRGMCLSMLLVSRARTHQLTLLPPSHGLDHQCTQQKDMPLDIPE